MSGQRRDPWEDLVGAAMQGTARREPDPTAWGPPLGGLATSLRGDPAERLLAAAAAATTLHRAGAMPVSVTDSIGFAPVDERQPASPRIASLLTAAATGGRDQPDTQTPQVIVGLIVDRITAAGRRIPDAALPAMLTLATRRPPIAGQVIAAAGARGRWLAELNPDWTTLVEPGRPPLDDSDEAWTHGTPAMRRVWLTQVADADPRRALAAVESDWRSMKADERAGLIPLLAVVPGERTADLLERSLDDRAGAVRTAAARALARRLDSPYAQRARERLHRWISVRRTLTGRTLTGRTLRVAVPPQPDDVDRRDQIVGRVPLRLRTAVAAAPLAAWDEFGGSRVLTMGLPDEDKVALHDGWIDRILLERDLDWARVAIGSSPFADAGARLAALLPPAEVMPLALRVTRDLRRGIGDPVATARLLAGLQHPWPADLIDAWLAAVTATTATPAPWFDVASTVGLHQPLPLLPYLRDTHPILPIPAQRVVERAITLLTIRETLDEELPAP